MSDDLTLVRSIVDELFCRPESRYGGYRRKDQGHELLESTLFRFAMQTTERASVSLQIYRGLGDIGGSFWSTEARVLLRLAGWQHRALPNIRTGGYDIDADIGFVVTDRARYTLAEPGVMGDIAAQPSIALRHLLELSEALALIHRQGLLHRNLWPGTIEYLVNGDATDSSEDGGEVARDYQVRLSRFEMSEMVGNLLRFTDEQHAALATRARRLYLGQGREALACLPPQRLAALFSLSDRDQMEDETCDVFSLGVIAWQWFCGSLPNELVQRALPLGLNGGVDFDPAAHDELLLEMRRRLPARSPLLAELLRNMLEPGAAERYRAASVSSFLRQHYEELQQQLTGAEAEGPRYLGFMPELFVNTLYGQRGWLTHSPDTPPGRRELQRLLQNDLREARLVYSPDGFARFGSDPAERTRYQQAKFVLLGKAAAWFCVIYFDPGGRSRGGRLYSQLLVVKYFVERTTAWRLEQLPLMREVGSLTLLPIDRKTGFDPEEVGDGQDWAPLLRTIQAEDAQPAWMADFERALRFVVDWRMAALSHACFPYCIIETKGHFNLILQLDERRNRLRLAKDALLTLYSQLQGVPMGDSLSSVSPESPTIVLSIYRDSDDRWDRSETPVATAILGRRVDSRTIEVRVEGSVGAVPDAGWIRWEEDIAGDRILRRERDGIADLMATQSLLCQLREPKTVVGVRSRWEGAGAGLSGDAPEVILRLLSSQPFFALHGPPGTGKTVVATRAIEATLSADPGQRILISAQSHYALDNLATRVLKRLEGRSEQPLIVRHVSRHAEPKLDPSMKRYTLEEVTRTTIDRVRDICDRRTKRAEDTEAIGELVREWRETVGRSRIELRERIRRGANLVFSTCGTATGQTLGVQDRAHLFDWAIVEEAAKAWPTELALPLVNGIRWTLIGDHRQLGAYNFDEIRRALAVCADPNQLDPELREHGARENAYLEAWAAFERLFETAEARDTRIHGSGAEDEAAERTPIDRLKTQFRMHPDIARVVSRSFYRRPGQKEGWLESGVSADDRVSPLTAPAALLGRALVWLDTEGEPGCNEEPYWSNDGEADIVRHLLEKLRPSVRSGRASAWAMGDCDPVAVLSPYRKQVDRLTTRLADFGPITHTIDSYQGREAELVICSLVRSEERGERVEANIGHLADASRVNVMLSRARHVLVIVGRFSHLQQAGDQLASRGEKYEFWARICRTVLESGARFPVAAVLGRDR